MRLLTHIFSSATDVSEFKRQLATPNVPKFSVGLIALAEKHVDWEVKVIILQPINSTLCTINVCPTALVSSCARTAYTVISNSTSIPACRFTITVSKIFEWFRAHTHGYSSARSCITVIFHVAFYRWQSGSSQSMEKVGG